MKEFELTLRVRNNRIKERRVLEGKSPRELAAAAGVGYGPYLEYEGLKRNPRLKNGEWRKDALRLAIYFKESVEELWPDAVLAVNNPIAVRQITAQDAINLMSDYQERQEQLATPPDLLLEDMEKREVIERLLDSEAVSAQERFVLQHRFGLVEAGKESTFREIGEMLDLGGERIRQIEAQALRRLQWTHQTGVDHEQRGVELTTAQQALVDLASVEDNESLVKQQRSRLFGKLFRALDEVLNPQPDWRERDRFDYLVDHPPPMPPMPPKPPKLPETGVSTVLIAIVEAQRQRLMEEVAVQQQKHREQVNAEWSRAQEAARIRARGEAWKTIQELQALGCEVAEIIRKRGFDPTTLEVVKEVSHAV